jgi:hypothetical protein
MLACGWCVVIIPPRALLLCSAPPQPGLTQPGLTQQFLFQVFL